VFGCCGAWGVARGAGVAAEPDEEVGGAAVWARGDDVAALVLVPTGSGGESGRTSGVTARDFLAAEGAFAGFVRRVGPTGFPVSTCGGAACNSIAGTSVRMDALQSSAAPAAKTPRMRRARMAKRTRRIMPASIANDVKRR
jgi:hypothetical protein